MRPKLLVVAALAGSLAVSTFGAVGSAAAKDHHRGFQDLGHAQWAASAIDMLSAQGVLNGMTPTQFAPGQPITIGQLAAILLRYQGQSQQGESFDTEVSQAQQDGMMSGLGGSVGSGEDATRAQAVTMIASALNLQSQGQAQLADLGHFSDTSRVPGWARHSLALAVELGLLAGSGGNLMPNGPITRAELAVILQRVEMNLGLLQANAVVRGTFVSTGATTVNGQSAQTITITAYTSSQGNQTYTVVPNAPIDVGTQAGSISNFAVGDQVMITLDQNGEASAIVDLQGMSSQQAHAGSVSGTVTAIGNGQITIAAVSGQGDYQSEDHGNGHGNGHGKDHGNLPSGTYTLSPAVKIVVPGEGAHGSLTQVQVGMLVRLVVGPSGLVDMIIVHPQEGGGGTQSGTPTGLTASETATGIGVSWTGVTGATSYQVLESSGGAYAPVTAANGGTPTGTSTTVIGLTAGTTYTFEVEAVSSSATSFPSAASSAIEWGAAAGVTATVAVTPSGSDSSAQIGITYDKALTASSLDTTAADYTVTDHTTGTALPVQSVSASGSTVTVVTQAVPTGSLPTDSLAVTTSKSVVDDAAGAPTTPINTIGSAAIGVPTGVAAQEAATGVALTWTGISGATSYQVLESSGGAYAPVTAAMGGTPSATSTTVTGLTAGTTYTFEVQAVSAGDTSAASAASSAVEWGARAGAAATVSVTTSGSQTYATLGVTYDKSLNTSSLDTTAADYTVTDHTTGATLGVQSVSANGSTVSVVTQAYPIASLATDDLSVTTTKSVVNDAAGAPTTPIDATGAASLATPTNLAAQESATYVALTWTGVSGATSYQVLASSGGAYSAVTAANGGTPSGTSTTVTGLTTGTTYTFEVEAAGAGSSLPSAASSTVEWGAQSASTATATVTQTNGEESFRLTIAYDKPLTASSLDMTLGNYTITDTTTHQTLGVASVAISGQALVIETPLGAPLTLTDSFQVTSSGSVVTDAAGAPTTPLDATGTF